jgi:4-aminobutyrate aminotransferase-like enzyme
MRFFRNLKENAINGSHYGLVLDIGGYYKNVFTLAPALTMTFEEMDLFIALFEQLLKRCGS